MKTKRREGDLPEQYELAARGALVLTAIECPKCAAIGALTIGGDPCGLHRLVATNELFCMGPHGKVTDVVEMRDFKTGAKVTGLRCPKCEFPVVGGEAELAEHLRSVCPLRHID